jgi:hypothetical protein
VAIAWNGKRFKKETGPDSELTIPIISYNILTEGCLSSTAATLWGDEIRFDRPWKRVAPMVKAAGNN